MIGASIALNQSQHIVVSHYHPVWLRPKMDITLGKVDGPNLVHGL